MELLVLTAYVLKCAAEEDKSATYNRSILGSDGSSDGGLKKDLGKYGVGCHSYLPSFSTLTTASTVGPARPASASESTSEASNGGLGPAALRRETFRPDGAPVTRLTTDVWSVRFTRGPVTLHPFALIIHRDGFWSLDIAVSLR